jgi:two-component system CheB/CheR fusion protein
VVLQTVIERAVEAVRTGSETQNHQFHVAMPPEPIVVRGDATRLEQIFANLLNNSIKYTEGAGEIALTLVANMDPARGRREAVIRVRDNGIGMSPDMLPRVFDLFAQADHSMARAHGGLGIGLNIVRSLVELHGGEVSAHSAGINLGSEFVVRLPLADEASASDSTERKPERTPESVREPARGAHRFLVVDDSADVAESTATMLGLQGHAVHAVTRGEDAIAAALDFEPDVVLLDIGMPGIDGYAVAREIRAHARLHSVKLIAVSGYGTDLARRRAREAGFDHHFTKPLDLSALHVFLQA